MLPDCTAEGYLPPGIHASTFEEVRRRFGASNERRRKLCGGLIKAIKELSKAGCRKVYLGGSFVTTKANPNDVDGCWDPIGVNWRSLDPVFFDFSEKRKAMKQKYGVDFFMANQLADGSGRTFQEFFQSSRDGDPRGVVLLDIS